MVVPTADKLTTALGGSARDALVALAKAQAEIIEAAESPRERNAAVRVFMGIVKQLDGMDRADEREEMARTREERVRMRNDAAMEWMNRRDEKREAGAAERAAAAKLKASGAGTPDPSFITDLRERRKARGVG